MLASLQNVQKDKGKIHKGPNFDSKRLSTFDKAKMMDLMVILSFLLKSQNLKVELESTTQKLMQQESYIRSLKSKMRKHAMEKGCSELQPDENESFNEGDDLRGSSADNFRKRDL